MAVENQLAMDATIARGPRTSGTAQEQWLRRPESMPQRADAAAYGGALFALVNRLLPVKVAARVLANAGAFDLGAYRATAALAARELGLRLRAEDLAEGRKGAARRWIALPVGEDEHATLERFSQHFTLSVSPSGRLSGALAQLGLAVVHDGQPLLTDLGVGFAVAPNPILDQRSVRAQQVLSDEERGILVRALAGNVEESEAIRDFERLVRATGGEQTALDAALQEANGWSSAQAVAHRAAMLGRLRDMGVAEAIGRGPSATIEVDLSTWST